MYRELNHVVNNRNLTGIQLNVAFVVYFCVSILFLDGAITASALGAQG